METKQLSVNGINVAYIEKNAAAAQTIFFIHGNSVSKRSWRKQYSSTIFNSYRLIAIDLPSHGESGNINDAICSLPGIASFLCDVVNALANNNPFILAGISLSTNIIAEMLAYNIKPAGLVLAGASIVSKEIGPGNFIKPNTHVGVVFTDESNDDDIAAYASETSFSRDADDINIFLEDFKQVRKPFRSMLGQSIATADYTNEIALVQQRNIPSLLVFGKDEAVVDPHYLDNIQLPLWNNTIYKIEGASHLVNIDQPEAFNNLLKSFADDIFK